MTPPPPPFLRTLAPLLQGLERGLRTWLDRRLRFPVSEIARAEVQGVADDLRRKAEALDVEKPLLIVLLMGGTGVGKSTLLNALAGAKVAAAAVTRPTTRDPVVYFHRSVNPESLDPALRLCRLAQHDRATLEQKVIVDTPDLDSNDTANRDRLLAVLPVADVVLYVGSQEKYHDQLGWELFRSERKRRAFAFVLNKWDRCQHTQGGISPDQDLLNDLKAEGFENPKLFRTQAEAWVESRGETPGHLAPGEQFAELRDWLELGITRLEIESVKARGVGQLLDHTRTALAAITPPDLAPAAARTITAWTPILAEEAEAQADALVGTLDPFQNEVEQHFAVRGHQRFRGLMAAYLRLTTSVRYAGSALRTRVPFVPRFGADRPAQNTDSDIRIFAQSCARAAGERVLKHRLTALTNRLMVEANQNGFPLTAIAEPTREVARLDWEERAAQAVLESLIEVEAEVAQPTGWKRYTRGIIGFLGNVLPEAVLVGSILLLLWRFFVEDLSLSVSSMLLPLLITLGALVVLHVLILVILPVRWSSIRGEFRSRLGKKFQESFQGAFRVVPGEVAATVAQEAAAVRTLAEETEAATKWLLEREQAARVAGLYGR